MEAQFLIAGFGGQGVLLIGQLLAKAAMHEGKRRCCICGRVTMKLYEQ